MGEVLSQNEIDDLLSALNTGTLDAEEVKLNSSNSEPHIKEYNFARPSKFGKDQLRTLEMLFESYVRLLSTNFTVFFRTNVEAEVINSEAVAYQEFTNSMVNPSIMGIIDMYPLKGSVIIEMSSRIGYAVIDRLLGGAGDSINKVREFSDIEIAILERIMDRCSSMLVEPWQNVISLQPELEKVETNPQYAHIVSSNEMVALITINLQIGDVEGLMNICIPYMAIEPVMDKLNTKFWFSNMQKADGGEYNDVIEYNIEKTKIDCKAVLSNTTIMVHEFLNLQVGDVIRLNDKVDSDLRLYVGEKKKYYGKPGLINKHNAIQITDIIREEDA